MVVRLFPRPLSRTLFWGILLSLCMPWVSAAHPLGNFSVNHYSRLQLTSAGIKLDYLLDLAEIPTFQLMQEADITPEAGQARLAAFLTHQMQALQAGLRLEVNGQLLPWQGVAQQIALPPGAGGLPTMKLHLTYHASWPALAAEHVTLLYQDHNFPGRAGWQEMIAVAADGVAVLESSVPATDRSQGLSDYPADLLNSPPQIRQASLRLQLTPPFAPHAPVVQVPLPEPDRAPAAVPPVTLSPPAPRNAFTELITTRHLSPGIIALALLIAAGLGALHALEPGHGKTVVAAYLVGTRGTAWHALYLGLIVTLTHTIGVYILGGITLYASHSIVPEQLYPWLGVFSGLLVAGLGAYLFFQRFFSPLQAHAHGHHHTHHDNHHHHHHHHHDHEPAYAHAAAHAHHHAEGSHHHTQAHTHTHHHHPVPETVSFRTLLTLGITGGMIPCPAALVVLLSAVSLHRISFGLLLIVAFSIGLAAVLIAIGLLMVYARQFMGRLHSEGPVLSRWLPLTSALVMTLIGLAIAGQGLLQAVAGL